MIGARTPWPAQGDKDPHPGYERLCARLVVEYVCLRGHAFEVVFAADAVAPASWDCRCGAQAGVAVGEPEQSEHERRMAQVRERRSVAELEEQLADRLADVSPAAG